MVATYLKLLSKKINTYFLQVTEVAMLKGFITKMVLPYLEAVYFQKTQYLHLVGKKKEKKKLRNLELKKTEK